MKIGIITDIHSNIHALDASLSALFARGAEKIACLGDIIGIGANPEKCMQRIMNLDCLIACVAGNHETYCLKDSFPPTMDAEEVEFHMWERALLSDKSYAFMRNLPRSARIGEMYFTHYPDISIASHEESDRAALNETDAKYIFFGHDHTRSLNYYDGRAVCCVGTLGCPMKENLARAALLDTETGSIEFVDTEYDADAAARDLYKINIPASRTVLDYFYGGRCL